MIDGLVVREMLRRCNYDQAKLEALLRVLKGQTPVRFNPHHPHAQLITQLWDHYTESGFLSARILELLDAETIGLVDPNVIRDMVENLPEKPFPVMPVHDCFRVHPNYGNEVRRQYNQILHDLAQSNILQFMVRQFAGQDTVVNKLGDQIAPMILEANYTLS